MSKVIVDIWGGEGSSDHLARYIRDYNSIDLIVKSELENGFLVNLRNEVKWGTYAEFDNRLKKAAH